MILNVICATFIANVRGFLFFNVVKLEPGLEVVVVDGRVAHLTFMQRIEAGDPNPGPQEERQA